MKSELYTVHTYTHITTAACFLNIGIVTGQHVKASVCESSSSIEPPLQNLVKAGTVFKWNNFGFKFWCDLVLSVPITLTVKVDMRQTRGVRNK